LVAWHPLLRILEAQHCLELGPGVLAGFCLVSLVLMAFNSWALLFAIADAEIGQDEPGTD
jgi:hypothetical protein